MSDTTETPLDAIARRAKAMGWQVRSCRVPDRMRDLSAKAPSGAAIYYTEIDGVLDNDPGFSGPGRVCHHERALLEADGEALEALRALQGQLAQAEVLVADMRAQIERLTALVTGGGA